MLERSPRRPQPRPEREPQNRPSRADTPDSAELISIGRVIRVHGLGGQLKVIPYTDTLERFTVLRRVYLELTDNTVEQCDVERVKIQEGLVFLKLAGIDDRTAAEHYRGAWISVGREETPALAEGSYYTFDLMGLEVSDESGARIGKITGIEEYPANAVLVVESETEEIWIPALKDVVIAVDLDARRLTVRLPEGLPVYPKGGS